MHGPGYWGSRNADTIRLVSTTHERLSSPFLESRACCSIIYRLKALDFNQTTKLYNDSLDYLQGRGVVKNAVRAFELNRTAAEHGLTDAILAMGWFYANGLGVSQDVRQAKSWYRKAARKDEPKAMFNLGLIAYRERHWADARTWFTRASANGHHRSLFWLGKLFWRGHGVSIDKLRARQLFQQAADHKVSEAQRTIRWLRS